VIDAANFIRQRLHEQALVKVSILGHGTADVDLSDGATETRRAYFEHPGTIPSPRLFLFA
jgi:hypothetical protein